MYEISYDPIVIKEYVEDWKGEVLWKLDCTYSAKTDSKGRVVQMDVERRYGVGGTHAYTYDSNGYLVKKVQKDAVGVATRTTQYTWKDGNLVATELTMNYLSGWNDEKEDWHEAYLTEQEKMFITYGSQPLGALPFTAGLNYIYYYYEDVEFVSGLFGKTCKNLPTRILYSRLPKEYPEEWPEEYRDDSRGWEEELTFSYTFNADMTVATEKCIYQGENENTVVDPEEPAEETLVYIYEQGVNGIGELVKDQSHNAQTLYDLSGRRIAASSNRLIGKGIYIQNGRKVVK